MEWQPIETAPKDGTPIDIWCSQFGGRRLANYKREDLGGGNVFYSPLDGGYTCIRTATHWMPLPPPPVE